MFAPFLFSSEYENLTQYNNFKWWAGHFEFKNFYITGYNTVSQHGPDHRVFKGPNKIFSGHYHKRQANDNVVYIGNTFPMDFGDADDFERGCAIYDCQNDKVTFHNWAASPSYLKTVLSKVIEGKFVHRDNAYVKCVVDIEISYSEAQSVKELMLSSTKIREFFLEENRAERQESLEGDDIDFEVDDIKTIDEIIIEDLGAMKDLKNIKSATLVSIYKGLNNEI